MARDNSRAWDILQPGNSEHDWLEDQAIEDGCFLLKNGDFPASHVSLQGGGTLRNPPGLLKEISR